MMMVQLVFLGACVVLVYQLTPRFNFIIHRHNTPFSFRFSRLPTLVVHFLALNQKQNLSPISLDYFNNCDNVQFSKQVHKLNKFKHLRVSSRIYMSTKPINH